MIEASAAFIRGARKWTRPRWITLMGETGVGKTHCAANIWRYMKSVIRFEDTEYMPRKIYWPQFVSGLRAGDGFDCLRDMSDWPVLFLDDIGAERDVSGFSSEQLNMLLGCREGKWTIITTNLRLKDIGSIDPRMADRIIRYPNLFAEINTISYSERL
jgi:DNA replication protein DnaC